MRSSSTIIVLSETAGTSDWLWIAFSNISCHNARTPTPLMTRDVSTTCTDAGMTSSLSLLSSLSSNSAMYACLISSWTLFRPNAGMSVAIEVNSLSAVAPSDTAYCVVLETARPAGLAALAVMITTARSLSTSCVAISSASLRSLSSAVSDRGHKTRLNISSGLTRMHSCKPNSRHVGHRYRVLVTAAWKLLSVQTLQMTALQGPHI